LAFGFSLFAFGFSLLTQNIFFNTAPIRWVEQGFSPALNSYKHSGFSH